MIYQKLDITRSPQEQGFEPHSYDMVIASSVLHATPKLEETMANVRSLLRPGGHVVLLEATHRDHTRVGFLFGLFPDWWAGMDEGRDLDPFADIKQWDAIFKKTGFSGVDTRTLDRHGNIFPNTLFCTHAVNTKIARLDAPLSAPPAEKAAPQLVVIGGQSTKSARILSEVRQILPQRDILALGRLEDVLQSTIAPKSSFLVLSELDHETFSGIDETRFSAIKALLELAGTVLWLTENAWTERPYQAMSAGMLRSARLEYPACHNQSLDVDDAGALDVGFLAEQLLRLEEPSPGSKDEVLWTLEPEVYVSRGRAYVPRIKHDVDRNNRLNSKRRAILAPVDPRQTPVALREADRSIYLETAEALCPVGASSDRAEVQVNVDFSLANAIRVGDIGYWHLLQGTVDGTGKKVVALSQTNASIVYAHPKHIFSLPASAEGSSALLPVAASLVAHNIMCVAATGTSILVMEAPAFCIDAIVEAGKRRNVQVHLATANPSSSSAGMASVVRLHPYETDAGIKRVLPANLSAFFDLSDEKGAVASLGSRVASFLPPSCLTIRLGHIFQTSAAAVPFTAEKEEAQTSLIENAVLATASKTATDEDVAPTIKPVSGIDDLDDALPPSAVVDWRTEDRVAARVRAIDSGPLFVPDKTYLLLGLAGSLGRSLARWLVAHGARHVVISSRNPETPDPRWLADIDRLGGSITVLSIDVSSEASIDAGLARIRASLPPIAGIAYGPLVLHDALLASMDLAMMDVPVRSKVVGAQILHERFSSNDKNPLDFFVMFSSVATVGGNPGQANYTAANAFLQALAQKRHARGLPASTIAIGAVIGVGFLSRTGREEEFKLASDTDTISEDEFLTLFAEAVVSGRRTSSSGSRVAITDIADLELITGIPEFSVRHKDTVKFYDDPRFGNLKVPESRVNADGGSGSKSSVKELLLKAVDLEEVRDIIIGMKQHSPPGYFLFKRLLTLCTDGLSQKMRGILHIPADEMVNATAPLTDQGVDSLGAITVGSWCVSPRIRRLAQGSLTNM